MNEQPNCARAQGKEKIDLNDSLIPNLIIIAQHSTHGKYESEPRT